MVAFQVFAGILAFALPLMVLADVNPIEPSPRSVYRSGSTCRVTWQGDTDSTNAWKDMAIELMSGSNLDMVPVTTVTTNQDGSKDGSFEHTCPEVTPYSAIYFYQFTSRHTTTKTWTTRFTITGPDGSSTPPANENQPSGDPIPWGVGKLIDASAIVPPPSNSTSPGVNSTLSASSSRSSPLPSNSRLVASPSPSPSPSSSSFSGSASRTSSASGSTSTSGALANAVNDRRVWMTALGTLVAVFL